MSSSILFLFVSQAQICAAELLVAAAADMAPLEQPLTKAFERESGDRLRFSFGSSGMLARQVGHGAPFDVYLSANEQFVHDLARSGHLLPDSVRLYALGWLGIWTKGNRAARLEDLLSLARIAIPNPVHAPYGVAARQALARTGLWKKLESRIVYGENVRQALQYAESGNADAAVTAWSLVFGSGGVRVPESLHEPIRQAGAVLRSSREPLAARRFLDFLSRPAGRKLLSDYGFGLPGAGR